MVDAPGFPSWQEMQSSPWLEKIAAEMEKGIWPTECCRCQDTELIGKKSIRLFSQDRHNILKSLREDYLILGGILDNVCNSACQSCNPNLSTKIGSLVDARNYPRADNSGLLSTLPLDRILEIDLNGGEPTASPRYQQLLEDLPPNVKILRINTNGSRVLPNLENILKSGVQVLITLSLDGTGLVHDYVRWPIRWKNYTAIVSRYRELKSQYRNLKLEAWTTLHALNAEDFPNIKRYAQDNELDHSWAWLNLPAELDARASNPMTRSARKKLLAHDDPEMVKIAQQLAQGEDNTEMLDRRIQEQDQLRNINMRDYI